MPKYQLSADTHFQVLNCHTNRPNTICDQDFFNQPLLVMHSRGEPLSKWLQRNAIKR